MNTLNIHKPEIDGRKLRASNSRKKIVNGMLSLVQVGDFAPSAEKVAAIANVGLRTVFRHFSDMEKLYREMIIEVQNRFMPEVAIPFKSKKWQQQLAEFMERKSVIYEKIMPYRVAAKFHKHHSSFMKEHLIKWHEIEKNILLKILPTKIAEDISLFNALLLSLSFDSWLQLRLDQGLTPKQAEEVKKKIITALLTDLS